jgi:NAD(P)-dependent dehydrogenase (short-subunit alcohol dehydrogenase family)
VTEVRNARVLVVGASKGLGRGIARRLDDEGARLAVSARSRALLDELAADLTDPVVTVGDVRDPASCREIVDVAVAGLGGLDVLVYAAGMGVVATLAKATHEHWVTAFETNVVGASQVTAAAVPQLAASGGVAIYFSSLSAQLTPPWRGMGVYLACKSALEKAVEVWTLEEPRVRFTTLVVGATSGGHFFDDAAIADVDDLPGLRSEWHARGYLADQPLEGDDQARAVLEVIRARAQIDTMWVRPRDIMQLPQPESP